MLFPPKRFNFEQEEEEKEANEERKNNEKKENILNWMKRKRICVGEELVITFWILWKICEEIICIKSFEMINLFWLAENLISLHKND